ncbi:MAG: ABC transporter ATP-binding protein [Candidatus Heimdallarchaeota archaeon]|nr:MAG: ABC transporter ATP-binding protein [Candidatus Heimdallarchaeota archaeon]
MGWGLGLGSEEYDRIYRDRDLVRRIISYFVDHKLQMSVVIIFLTLTSFANSLSPLLSREAINELETTRDWGYLLLLILLTFTLNGLGWIFNFFRQRNSSLVIGNVVLKLRQDVNTAVLNHDLSFYDKYPTGKIVSRINTDSQDFGQTAELTMQVISSFLIVFVVLGALLTINIPLTITVLGMVPFIFIIALAFRKVARKRTLEGQRALATVNSFVQESVSGISIAKTFRQEKKLYNKFNGVNEQSYRANLRRAYVFNFIFPALSIVQGVALVLLMWIGGEGTLGGHIKAGDFYLFFQSLWLFFFPLLSIASFWPAFQAGLAASERIFALIDTPPTVLQDEDRILDKIHGKIEFVKLGFSYVESSDILDREKQNYLPEIARAKVFSNFSLKINPGESLAIVGHTGAGKSSLAKLIARFYEFQEGDITIDEISIRNFNLKAYRKHIGIIPQTPFLWADTLENNIKYSKPSATKDEVLWALEQAGGADWVEDLPNGLETNIRERGALLSMGQRQLVVFARTLLENPSILILDEATASVDPFTETRIQEALEKTIEGRTSIIIAHRLWTVRHVDRIIVIDHGKIVEKGNHEELMEKGGHYATLYDTYFRHQSLDYIEKTRDYIKAVKEGN